MSLRTNADFLFGPTKAKVIPLNSDLSTPLPVTAGSLTTLQSVGWRPGTTIDVSGLTPNAVEFKIKINETEDAVTTIDLSTATGGVSDETAVTAAEFVAAITTASYTGITASVDSRGYVVIDVTVPGTDTIY
jgi:hypothetical protein